MENYTKQLCLSFLTKRDLELKKCEFEVMEVIYIPRYLYFTIISYHDFYTYSDGSSVDKYLCGICM